MIDEQEIKKRLARKKYNILISTSPSEKKRLKEEEAIIKKELLQAKLQNTYERMANRTNDKHKGK
ncbi:MAG: hypothetical protein IJI43_01610 [Bacilli bacterium]|nr:hypothetical protein [Bacilli bacterium]